MIDQCPFLLAEGKKSILIGCGWWDVEDNRKIPAKAISQFKYTAQYRNHVVLLPKSKAEKKSPFHHIIELHSKHLVATLAGSHQNKGWEEFTDAVVRALSQKRSGLVFILWGAYAQKKGEVIDPKKHHVLQSPHPSPFSANRGFFGSKPFSGANHYLHSSGAGTIDWDLTRSN